MKKLFRAEPGYLMAYNFENHQVTKIIGNYLKDLEIWIESGKITDLVKSLAEVDLINLEGDPQEKKELKKLIKQSRELKEPLRSMYSPEIMNIELTTRCPLRCPQCYCDLHKGKDVDLKVALHYIEEAGRLKIPFINLSGGETLVYPHLMELIAAVDANGLSSAIAISGWGFDENKLKDLKKAGVGSIYVSLNGSSSEINSISRDGYELAINSLKLLQADGQVDYYVNWVARNDNVKDFPELLILAKSYGVKGVVILESKPDAKDVLQAVLSKEHFLSLVDIIKNHNQEEMELSVEPCFSPMRAYLGRSYFFNRNIGFNKGCGAGRNSMAVDVDGNLIPCRHLLYPEHFENIEEYWQKSMVLDKLRKFEDYRQEPCESCSLKNNCLSCRATADKVEKDLHSGNHYCPVKEIIS